MGEAPQAVSAVESATFDLRGITRLSGCSDGMTCGSGRTLKRSTARTEVFENVVRRRGRPRELPLETAAAVASDAV
jgi:hypothetical protein